jgi:hypothetical protein
VDVFQVIRVVFTHLPGPLMGCVGGLWGLYSTFTSLGLNTWALADVVTPNKKPDDKKATNNLSTNNFIYN